VKLDAPAAIAGDADAANAARTTSRFMRPSINPGASSENQEIEEAMRRGRCSSAESRSRTPVQPPARG
jgi:hypothetical protein